MAFVFRMRDAQNNVIWDVSWYRYSQKGTIYSGPFEAKYGSVTVPLVGPQKLTFLIASSGDRQPDVFINGGTLTYQTYGECWIHYGVR